MNNSVFRVDVQGLRAVAVLLVLLFHFETPIKGGYLGVDMFFVISGFVIASSTFREIDRTYAFSWRNFLRRRVRRLLPGIAVVSILVTAASIFLLSPFGPQQTTSQMLVGAATYTSNFMLMSRNYFSLDPKSNPLMHFWSLAVEEQFYLLWPLAIGALLYVRRRLGKTLSAIVVWLIVLLTIYSTCRLFVWFSVEGPTVNDYSWFRPLIERDISPQRFAFYSPLTRAWEFVAGVVIVLVLRNSWIRKLHVLSAGVWIFGIALVIAGVRWATVVPGYEQGADTATNSSATILAVIGTAMVLLAGEFVPFLQKVLTIKPLVVLGDWSYSVYLWHWPVWVLLITTFNRSWQVTVFAFGLSVILGWAQFHWIENPVRSGKRLPRANYGVFVGAFALVAVFIYGFMSVVTPAVGQHLAGRNPDKIDLHIVEESCQSAEYVLGVAKTCVYGSESFSETVILAGDSLARSLSDGFVKAVNDEGRNAMVFSYPGCGFLIEDSVFTPTDECRSWRADVIRSISEVGPVLLVISNLSDLYVGSPLGNYDLKGTREAWGYELSRTLELLSQMETSVIITQPPPLIKNDLRYDISLLHRDGAQEPRSIVLERRKQINDVETAIAANFSSVKKVLNFDNLFCDESRCSQKFGKQFLFEDADHLSVEGSLFVSDYLKREINETTK